MYAHEPAAAPGRLEPIVKALGKDFEFMSPSPASEKDLRLVHFPGHVEDIKRSQHLYELATLSVGGALLAADLAWKGNPAFGLIRPPGHHASPDSCWGFCYFNNIAIALKKLMQEGKIKKALILDFDLHFGDGTENSFRGIPDVIYFHPESYDEGGFIENIRRRLEQTEDVDILAVSAGFDRHVDDWGGLLTTEDYRTIGSLAKRFSEKVCAGRRFAVLEGGYNHSVLGQNVRAFLEGMN